MSHGHPCLYLDDERRTVRLGGGRNASLRAKSFAALELLARHAPDCVSKDLFAQGVWNDRIVSDESITQCVADIRRALGDCERSIVQTVPGRGYRLLATVRSLADDELTNAIRPTLAVLPFNVLCDEPRWHHFGHGLTVDVVSDLTRSGACTVLSPSLIEPDGGSTRTLARSFGQQGARWVVAGTLQCDEDSEPLRLRVSVQLLDARNGAVDWTRRWEELAERFFWLQDRIVAGIVNGIADLWSGRLAVLTEREARGRQTLSLNAYEHFQCGVIAASAFTPEGFAEAVRCFTTALELDPEYGEAWSTLAIVYGIMAAATTGDELEGLVEARLDAARRAYSHRPRGPWALLSDAWVAALEGDGESARVLIREAVSEAPHDADLLGAAAGYAALNTDLYDEAERWGTRALELNPRAPDWYHFPIGYARFLRGDPAGALAALRRGPQTYAELIAFRAASEAELGRTSDAALTVTRMRDLYPHFSTASYVASEAFAPDKAARLAAAFQAAGLPD